MSAKPEFRAHRHTGRKRRPMQTRRIGASARNPEAAANRVPFPGMNLEASDRRKETVATGTFATMVHAALLALLLLLAWLTPEVKEVILPVRLIKEEAPPSLPPREELPEPEVEPAPAPKALAERRSLDFAPAAQAVAPQIVNPTVVAPAAPQVVAQKIELAQLAQVVAPTHLQHNTAVAERVKAINSSAVAETAKIDLGAAAAPALRGPADAVGPAGASVGPSPVVPTGSTIGTGGASALGSGSSAKEGVLSGRDVLGSPDGAPLANVATRVGDSFLRGDGGQGTGALSGQVSLDECMRRPEVQQYMNHIRERMYSRWVLPSGNDPSSGEIELRFKLDPSGSVINADVVRATDAAVGTSASDALRSAAPFAVMPERVRCLARRGLIGTFSTSAASG